MAWCYLCGRYWIVRTGQYVLRTVMSRSRDGVLEPPDLPCPKCAPVTDTSDETNDG